MHKNGVYSHWIAGPPPNMLATHPLRFLGHIFSTRDLKKRMTEIKDGYFKWDKFTEGLFHRLTREAHNNNIHRFIPGFAQTVGCSEDVIEDYARRHDWSGMLDYLMHR